LWTRGPVFRDSLAEMIREIGTMQQVNATPAPIAPPPRPAENWLARRNDHMGGHDLLTPPQNPDFWSKKENLTEEYRIHSFNNKSIRAGVKAPRDGARPHAWIRSYDGGWAIRYAGFESRRAMRELAHRAVNALGLQFGAVDLGRKADGGLIVLEVNRCPGIEGGTTESYARAIERWMNGE